MRIYFTFELILYIYIKKISGASNPCAPSLSSCVRRQNLSSSKVKL